MDEVMVWNRYLDEAEITQLQAYVDAGNYPPF